MKKLFINHTRFLALPVIISTGVRMVGSYRDGKLDMPEAGKIVASSILLMLLLFPVYLVLRMVWRKIFVQKPENQ